MNEEFDRAKSAEHYRSVHSERLALAAAGDFGWEALVESWAVAPRPPHGADDRPNCSIHNGGLWPGPWVRRAGGSVAQIPAREVEPV